MARLSQIRATLLASILISFVAFTSPTIFAQDKINLRGNMTAGLSWTFNEAEQMDLTTSMKMAGNDQKAQQKAERRLSGKVDVIEANNGRASVVRVTFDRECGGTMDNGMGQKMPLPFPLAGQTVTIKRDPTTGQVTHDGAAKLDPQDEQELTGLIEGDDSFLPKQPVGVGETWSPDVAAIAKRWQVDPNTSKIGLGLTLKEVRDMGGRQVAVVAINGAMDGDIQGMSGSRRMQGVSMIDMQTGRAVDVNVTGTMTLSGMKEQQGQDGNTYVIELKSEGTTSSKSHAQFASAGGGMGGINSGGGGGGVFGGGQAPAPAPSPAPNPAPVGDGGGNVLPGGSGPEGTFTYRDEKILFTFTSDPRVPGIAGSITMGNQKFPVRVQSWNGTDVAGVFEASGSEFKFTGKVEGDGMVFTTDGTNYNLKNAAPAKRNPLGR